jgi:hypothetical protein
MLVFTVSISPDNVVALSSAHLIAEYEIVTETEDEGSDGGKKSKSERTALEQMQDCISYTSAGLGQGETGKSSDSDDLADLEAMASRETDKQFSKFRERISRDPDQVSE